MEVGAVKQAFNNEVIHLKKNLNQAKIHVIHKLTRKAKTLNERKASEILKEKLKRKAESAVNEVLIIKKIKPRDVAKFIVTHTGKLNDHLNKPQVDNNKACARLLLHKSLTEKYKLIRDRFGNISINDLFMSRHERLKIKKELQDKQKEKRNSKVKNEAKINKESTMKDNLPITQDDWDDKSETYDSNDVSDSEASDDEKLYDKIDANFDGSSSYDVKDGSSNDAVKDCSNKDSSDDDVVKKELAYNGIGRFVKRPSDDIIKLQKPQNNGTVKNNDCKSTELLFKEHSPSSEKELKPKQANKSKNPNKQKDGKNKNINAKILKRNFKNQSEELPAMVKVIDPFFVTSTGDNYMSIAESRAPDEIKEEHKQGNRQYRRAIMFGHVPKIKPRKKYENNKFNNNQTKLKNPDNQYQKNTKNISNNKNDRHFNNDKKIDEKPEKLHPSWEAKKKISSILPFQGKKIVFDDS